MPNSELFSTILAAFRSAGWNYAEVEGREVIRAGFEAHHTRVELHVQAFEGLATVSVVAESPEMTEDPTKRERLVELAMRVNQTLTVGNFELNWDDGRMYFRCANLFPDPLGNAEIIQGMVHNTVGEMDRMAPLVAILHRTEGPDLAGLSIEALLEQDDLIPEVPVPKSGDSAAGK
jgi:hypothetical protein